jgi:hypothetical protein
VAIKFLFGMNEPDYQKYCLHATFVGTPQLVPRDSGTSQAVLNFVALVKVVKIDGLGPGDAGYPLTDK